MSVIRESEVQTLIRCETTQKNIGLMQILKEFSKDKDKDKDIDIGEGYHVAKLDIKLSSENVYSLYIELNGKWDLTDNLSLGSMQLLAKYENGTFTFTFISEFKFNSTSHFLTAELGESAWSCKAAFAGGSKFKVVLGSKYNVVSYVPKGHINVKNMIKNFSETVASEIPEELEIKFKSFVLVYEKSKGSFLIQMKLDSSLDLSTIDFLSEVMSNDFKLEVSDLRLLYSTASLDKEALKTINNNLIEESKIDPSTSSDENGEGITKGLSLGAKFQLGTEKVPVSYAFTKDNKAVKPRTEVKNELSVKEKKKESTLPSDKGVTWTSLKMEKGPLKISRIGFTFKESKLFIFINASVEIKAVKFTVIGLGVGSSLKELKPEFAIKGVALEVKTPALQIAGLLYKEGDTYNGSALIKTPTIGLSAIASYQTKPYSSLFLYARADFTPIGPVFFMVDGLTIGVGINRNLIVPKLDKIAEFPLVSYAMTDELPTMEQALVNLEAVKIQIPAEQGRHFVCFGLKFSSFKIINSFALVTVSFGKGLDVNLMGMSKMVMPPKIGTLSKGITPIAVVKMGFMATYLPDKGELSVRAKILPGSYIFSEKCVLTGGFAFSVWFAKEHTGDFVLTLGGYHPKFKVPIHYPKVEPVALNWNITKDLKVKGSVYFALCSHAIMAGASLEASYMSGNVSAWFKATLDLLLAWKPFYYEISLSIEVGGRFTLNVCLFGACLRQTLSISVGAGLEIWGPDFAGKALVDIGPLDIKIAFGDNSSKNPKPISWDEFRKTFLPKQKEEFCKTVIKDGLVRTIELKKETSVEKISVVNPGDFVVLIDGVVPNNTIWFGNKEYATENDDFGIAPMNLNKSKVVTTQTIKILLADKPLNEKQYEHFMVSENKKSMPTALWGESNETKTNGARFVEDALSGLKIQPAKAIEGACVPFEPRTEVSNVRSSAFKWSDFKGAEIAKGQPWDNFQQAIQKNAKRTALIASLGLEEVDFSSEQKLSDWYLADAKTIVYK